jgi:hypothetical protein
LPGPMTARWRAGCRSHGGQGNGMPG